MFTSSRYGRIAMIAGLICVSSAAAADKPVKPAASTPSEAKGPKDHESNGNTAVHEAVKEGIRGRDLAEIASGRPKPPRSPH